MLNVTESVCLFLGNVCPASESSVESLDCIPMFSGGKPKGSPIREAALD